ncbi:MAG: MFS transporter [Chloroflexi bacterium]|nr:MFS transporter [Chloroflexota bacterium]
MSAAHNPAYDPNQPVGYRQLLKQNPRFRTLWIAQLISTAGDWFNSVAVLGLVLQLTRSGLGASLVLLAGTLPMFFLMPIAGPVADRFDRRTVMILSNLFSAGVALLFILVKTEDMVWLLYVASVLLVVSASFFNPASSASIPNIVTRGELFSANALGGASWGIMLLVGSALGGIVSTLLGRDAAFVINALSFLLAAGLIALIEIPSPRTTHQRMTPVRDFVEGMRYLRANLPSMALVAIELGWGFGAGVVVLLSVLGTQVFRAGDAGIGILYAGRGLGVLIGPFLVPALAGNNIRKLRHVVWLSFLLAAIGYLIVAYAGWKDSIGLAFFALMLAHFGGGVIWAVASILLQITTPDRLRGRVLAVNGGLGTLGSGISTLLFGLALEAGTVPMTLAVVGAALFAAYGLFWGLVTAGGPFHISEATMVDSEQPVTQSQSAD